MADEPARRIVVIGSTGSGKSTMARAIATRLGIPHLELDALYWDADWAQAPVDVFRARVAAALTGPAWVVDGNYAMVRDLVWPYAELIVWLDFTLPLVLARLLRRTFGRVIRREELWNGNRESLRSAFLSRDSIVLWALQTYGRRRREFPIAFREPPHRHLRVIRLRAPRGARAWLRSLE